MSFDPNQPQPGQPPQQPSQYPQYPQPSNPGYPPQGQQLPPTQYPPQQPPTKKNKRIGCSVIGATIVIVIIIAIAAGNAGKGGTTTTTAQPAINASGTPLPTPTPTPVPTWQTTHTYSGNGSKKTETIAVPDDWKIGWSCTPGSFDGIDYNVIVSVTNSDNTPADPSAVNTTCKSTNKSGETEEHQAGNIFLDITSEGDWTFTIQELK